MRRLVEDVGAGWSAGRFGTWRRLTGATTGTVTVGTRAVAWTRTGSGTVGVAHADAGGAEVNYSVAMVTTRAPHGADRPWWSCPVCACRVGLLYLPGERDRLACRGCCGLGYASQYGVRRPPRQRAPAFTCTVTVSGWNSQGVGFRKMKRVRTFSGRAFATAEAE